MLKKKIIEFLIASEIETESCNEAGQRDAIHRRID